MLIQIGAAAESEEQAFNIAKGRMSGAHSGDPLNAAAREFRLLPEPVKGLVSSLTSQGWQMTLASAKKELNAVWRSDVLPEYKDGLQGRYPLVKDSGIDATMADFSRFFASNGTIDKFFKEYLSSFVNTKGATWKPVSMNKSGVGLSKETLRQFQNAAKIRDIFFANGGAVPSVIFELKPLSLDANAASFRLYLEGQSTEYRHGPSRPQKFVWPGPEINAGVRTTFLTLDGEEFGHSEEGSWAWIKTLDQAEITNTSLPDRFLVTFQVRGYTARYELRANSVKNPFRLKELENFRLPESL